MDMRTPPSGFHRPSCSHDPTIVAVSPQLVSQWTSKVASMMGLTKSLDGDSLMAQSFGCCFPGGQSRRARSTNDGGGGLCKSMGSEKSPRMTEWRERESRLFAEGRSCRELRRGIELNDMAVRGRPRGRSGDVVIMFSDETGVQNYISHFFD